MENSTLMNSTSDYMNKTYSQEDSLNMNNLNSTPSFNEEALFNDLYPVMLNYMKTLNQENSHLIRSIIFFAGTTVYFLIIFLVTWAGAKKNMSTSFQRRDDRIQIKYFFASLFICFFLLMLPFNLLLNKYY